MAGCQRPDVPAHRRARAGKLNARTSSRDSASCWAADARIALPTSTLALVGSPMVPEFEMSSVSHAVGNTPSNVRCCTSRIRPRPPARRRRRVRGVDEFRGDRHHDGRLAIPAVDVETVLAAIHLGRRGEAHRHHRENLQTGLMADVAGDHVEEAGLSTMSVDEDELGGNRCAASELPRSMQTAINVAADMAMVPQRPRCSVDLP